MDTVPADMAVAVQLLRAWEELLARDTLGQEVAYRIGKLADRAEPIRNKAFLKTGKGQEMTRRCLEMTQSLRAALARGGEVPWAALTDLETLFDDLLRTAYAFRVRAG